MMDSLIIRPVFDSDDNIVNVRKRQDTLNTEPLDSQGKIKNGNPIR